MEIYLPNKFTKTSMYRFIDETIDADMNPRSNHIIFDFTTLKFILPVGITVLSNLIGRLRRNGTRVTFKYDFPDRSKKSCPMAFLDDSMFFHHYLHETLDPSSKLRPTTLPLANVAYSNSFQYLSNAMTWLSKKLFLTKKSLADIETALKEIFNNIQDHSSEHEGSVFIQHYPNENKVTLSISDFGVGIPFNIQKLHPFLSDGEAIKMAIREGFTTKTTPRNRGAGLDLLLHNVVKNNCGEVYIHSNHGILCCKNDGFGNMDISYENVEGFYPGTLLDIQFRTDTIENVEEEFIWE